MCTLAIYFRVFERFPVVVAANRDEFKDRPALPPVELRREPRVIGGQDLKAGGTWLGFNEHGVLAALLNRRSPTPNDPALRSRGLLCLEALSFAAAAEAASYAGRQTAADYNPFNLLIASKSEAFVAYNRGTRLDVIRLTPGLHLLTNLDLNDVECPRISRSYQLFNRITNDSSIGTDSSLLRTELQHLLADHATQLDARQGGPNSLCLHLDSYGTRSSSLIFMGAGRDHVEHFFAEGPPCTTPYKAALT
jgi:uncharacterized protein with NRDE domain